ncbi:DUF2651 family protein [Bacillus sp. BRMEA1]|uniref:DUF2651 family protein n=1 Tax=Neobacillus endophyticus TaxID=2738405 RepID=UPI001564AD9B|nr:DUF2651 family protein [Neobacillus endophyticus]NRD80003.1 DUF2651 family protein [Neobacillus endophyticus]
MNPFELVLFIFPIVVIVTSVLGFLLLRKWFIMPFITAMFFTILTFTVFNETFFHWVVIYTLLSIAICFPMKFIKMRKH